MSLFVQLATSGPMIGDVREPLPRVTIPLPACSKRKAKINPDNNFGRIYMWVRDHGGEVTQAEIRRGTGLDGDRVSTILLRTIKQGLIVRVQQVPAERPNRYAQVWRYKAC